MNDWILYGVPGVAVVCLFLLFFLEPQKPDTPKIKDLPKMPTPVAVYGVQMPGTVALYGCQVVPDTNGHLYKGDRITPSGNTTTIADYTDKKADNK